MKASYWDLRKWFLAQETISIESLANTFSLSLADAKAELDNLMLIGAIARTPEKTSPLSYEVLDGSDPLVEIHSLTSIWNRVEKERNPETIAILSFADDESRFPEFESSISHFKVVCQDIDYPLVTNFKTFFHQCDEAARFIHNQVKAGKKILCQCEYGVSRSAGAAAAILEAYHYDGIQVFSSFEFKPNKTIYKKLLTSLIQVNKQHS